MRTRTSAFALLAILALVCWGFESPALFGQSKILTTTDLTNQAEVVAVGKVATMKPEWSADKTRIYTRVTVSIREYLKGGGEQQMSILTPGGEIGEIGEIYSGTAQFHRDEEVVVFARKKSGKDYEVAGGSQGRIPINEEKGTGMKTVFRNTSLDDFRSQVKSAAQAIVPGEKRP